MERTLSLDQEAAIKKRAQEIKKEKNLKNLFPIVVFGDEQNKEKEFYIAYMMEPTLAIFSKFMAVSKRDEVMAMKALAKDCFLEGDKELIDDDSLYLRGLQSELGVLMQSRQTTIVNF